MKQNQVTIRNSGRLRIVLRNGQQKLFGPNRPFSLKHGAGSFILHSIIDRRSFIYTKNGVARTITF